MFKFFFANKKPIRPTVAKILMGLVFFRDATYLTIVAFTLMGTVTELVAVS